MFMIRSPAPEGSTPAHTFSPVDLKLNAPVLPSTLGVVAPVRFGVWRHGLRLPKVAGRDERLGNVFFLHQVVFHRLRALF